MDKKMDLNILFIGNSHTYYNDMPRLVKLRAVEASVIRPALYHQGHIVEVSMAVSDEKDVQIFLLHLDSSSACVIIRSKLSAKRLSSSSVRLAGPFR